MPDPAATAVPAPPRALGALPVRPVAPAPCTAACPAGVNVKAYVSLIAEGRFDAALGVVRRRCPLPSICGRICHAPCEAACARAEHDDPLAIRALKRFVADAATGTEPLPEPAPDRGQRVAVVGSGPAGLTAAYDLRLLGYGVTIFEAEDEPGGMLRHGIAEYRLPRDVLDAELDVLWRTGIEVRTGEPVADPGRLERLLAEGYDAVLLAVGAQRGRRLGIAGEDELEGVEDALAFLRRAGDRDPVSGRVVVIGGGSTAVEAARTALRFGASSVQLLYRRSRREMPAGAEEVRAAAAEGVEFRFLLAPVRLVGRDARVAGVECLDVALGAPDAGGRPRPVPIPGTEQVVAADLVLGAVGQEVELTMVADSLAAAMIDRGTLRADPDTLMTRMWGVFGAGDAVTGPATVIDAIAAGHRAAESIRSYLEHGYPRPTPGGPPRRTEYELPDPPPPPAGRLDPEAAPMQAGSEFAEVEQPYSAEVAVAEAARCLRCGPCGECVLCAPGCDRRHLLVGAGGESWELRVPSARAAGVPAEAVPLQVRLHPQRCRGCALCRDVCMFDAFSLEDPTAADSRVVLDTARCRGCGLCVAVCPTAALEAVALSRDWWRSRLDEIFAGPDEHPEVVLTCSGRAEAPGEEGRVVRFRCVGQVDAGMLLEVCRRGAAAVAVAGCAEGACRFGAGARLAGDQVATARTMLRLLGGDPDCVAAALPVREPVGAGAGGGW